MSLVHAGENVMVFRTFAKAHGLTALPFGYAIAPRALAEHLRKQGIGCPRDQNRLALTAAAASLRDTVHRVRVNIAVTIERVAGEAACGARFAKTPAHGIAGEFCLLRCRPTAG